MAIFIDDKEIVFSTALLVKQGQDSLIDIPLSAVPTTLRISLRFVIDHSQPQGAAWVVVDNLVRFTCTNWNNSFGVCTGTPISFGDVNGRPLFLQLAATSIGDNQLVHLWLLLGSSQ